MSGTKEHSMEISLNASNRITYEDLTDISKSFFENVYKEADRTLYKILNDERENMKQGGNGKDEQGINVISFLGERGRGKTSAMLSFIFWLNKLHQTNGWSLVGVEEVRKTFVCFPYIDAAMLAENEFLIDVILAQMWDQFEKIYKEKSQYVQDTGFEYTERKIKQQFMKVRTAYLTLKKKEREKDTGEDMMMPGALHELAASVNLREEFQNLIRSYLEIFDEGGTCGRKREVYLVFAIDDVDMSTKSAYLILEQIRRFLRQPRVIVFITADIDRLHRVCEAKYVEIYPNEGNRVRLVDEYLEKILPYNMRIYMPEIRKIHDDIKLKTDMLERLELKNYTEKEAILEFMAQKCKMYFDGQRKKRHFLQNQSLRSLVNYFQQMERLNTLEYSEWLRTDLRERLIERLTDIEQKNFLKRILYCDYEDINKWVLNYLINCVKSYGEEPARIYSIGQILYVCSLYEEKEPENVKFVNCIIMLYSILLNQTDSEFLEQLVGGSALGEREYRMGMKDTDKTNLIAGIEDRNFLSLDIKNWMDANPGQISQNDCLREILSHNKKEIVAWLYAMLYVQPLDAAGQEVEFSCQIRTIYEGTGDEQALKGAETQDQEEKSKMETGKELYMRPQMTAAKGYFACLIKGEDEQRKWLEMLLGKCLDVIKKWVHTQEIWKQSREDTLNTVIEQLKTEILADVKMERMEEEILPVQNVELMYSIGQQLDETVASEKAGDKEAAFNQLTAKYRVIREGIQKCRTSYQGIVEETKFAEFFEKKIQVRLMLDSDFWEDDDLKNKFRDKLSRILVELNSMRNITFSITEPQA